MLPLVIISINKGLGGWMVVTLCGGIPVQHWEQQLVAKLPPVFSEGFPSLTKTLLFIHLSSLAKLWALLSSEECPSTFRDRQRLNPVLVHACARWLFGVTDVQLWSFLAAPESINQRPKGCPWHLHEWPWCCDPLLSSWFSQICHPHTRERGQHLAFHFFHSDVDHNGRL